MTITEIFSWIFEKRLDLFTLAVLVLVAGAKRWWVWGYQFDEMKKDRDYYRDKADRATDMASRSVNLLEKP